MATSKLPASEFRLGEDMLSDSSDSDQSAYSAQSPTSPTSAAKKSKRKKKQERRKVGALTDELDTLLGAAFQKPNGDAGNNVAAADNTKTGVGNLTTEVDTEKRMSKRTRQNIAKMEKRKLRQQDNLQRQAAGAGIQMPMLVDQQKHQKQSKKESTKARRLRKKTERDRKRGGQADAMEIG